MYQYVADTKYAVCGLIDLITVEEKRLSQFQNKYEGLSRKLKDLNQQLVYSPFNDLDPLREQAIAIASYRTHEELTNLQNQIVALRDSIDVKNISINALCGAVLQIAKQGISVTQHRFLSQCPDGRSIGTEKLKNVIWQARNQSLHYEEGNFNQHVTNCFANLEISLGNKFSLSLNMGKNLAHDVIEELGWKDYSTYESDLKSLSID